MVSTRVFFTSGGGTRRRWRFVERAARRFQPDPTGWQGQVFATRRRYVSRPAANLLEAPSAARATSSAAQGYHGWATV
eukprot:11223711-Lingulodinium_polyedra.AAC.1